VVGAGAMGKSAGAGAVAGAMGNDIGAGGKPGGGPGGGPEPGSGEYPGSPIGGAVTGFIGSDADGGVDKPPAGVVGGSGLAIGAGATLPPGWPTGATSTPTTRALGKFWSTFTGDADAEIPMLPA